MLRPFSSHTFSQKDRREWDSFSEAAVWPYSRTVYSLVHENTNIVGATEDISLFQLDCVSFQIMIGCLQIVFLLLMEREIEKSNSGREECSIIP